MKGRGFTGLRGRLAVGTLLVLIAAIVVADLTAFIGLRRLADQRASDNLNLAANRALAITRTLKVMDPAIVDRMSPANLYFAFYDIQGKLLLEHNPTDLGDAPMPDMPAPTLLSSTPTLVSVDGSDVGVVAIGRILGPEEQIPVMAQGHAAVVGSLVAGLTNYANVQSFNDFIALQIKTAIILLVIAVFSTFFILRISLRPLRVVADTAHDISRGDLSRRIPVSDAATEIGAVSTALNEAFDHVEASDASMRAFIADASHDLRTPLATIHGWADLYLHDGVREWADVDVAMTRIRDESARMTDLINQLLTLARMDSKLAISREDVDLGALAVDVASAMRITAPEHTIDVEIDGLDSCTVHGDAHALRQLVANLVANATSHTPAGTRVSLRVRSDHVQGRDVTLIVHDNGPGMSDAERDHAFDRFWRADPSRRPSGGTGLGLSIVRAIALAHGGTATLTSAPGEGLTVTVRLLTGKRQD